ncbi:Hypothetical_protein [Hexamita inflata]|uniref:Hypothetical_protein n=1 Tax=Hexamita inflata TaxID=28002 RepID=A0ABP1GF55_9EUKA
MINDLALFNQIIDCVIQLEKLADQIPKTENKEQYVCQYIKSLNNIQYIQLFSKLSMKMDLTYTQVKAIFDIVYQQKFRNITAQTNETSTKILPQNFIDMQLIHDLQRSVDANIPLQTQSNNFLSLNQTISLIQQNTSLQNDITESQNTQTLDIYNYYPQNQLQMKQFPQNINNLDLFLQNPVNEIKSLNAKQNKILEANSNNTSQNRLQVTTNTFEIILKECTQQIYNIDSQYYSTQYLIHFIQKQDYTRLFQAVSKKLNCTPEQAHNYFLQDYITQYIPQSKQNSLQQSQQSRTITDTVLDDITSLLKNNEERTSEKKSSKQPSKNETSTIKVSQIQNQKLVPSSEQLMQTITNIIWNQLHIKTTNQKYIQNIINDCMIPNIWSLVALELPYFTPDTAHKLYSSLFPEKRVVVNPGNIKFEEQFQNAVKQIFGNIPDEQICLKIQQMPMSVFKQISDLIPDQSAWKIQKYFLSQYLRCVYTEKLSQKDIEQIKTYVKANGSTKTEIDYLMFSQFRGRKILRHDVEKIAKETPKQQ